MEFKEITCCNCHVLFKITTGHNQELLSSKETFYCPNGHPQSYVGKSDKQKLEEAQRKIIVEKENCKRILEEKNKDIVKLNNKVVAYKGHLTRRKTK